MTKKIRRPISLLLAVVLIFCMASLSASATIYGKGTQQTEQHSIDGVKLTGSVTCYLNRAAATTSLSVTGGTVYAHVRLYYSTPASPATYVYADNQNHVAGKTVSTTKYIDTSLYTARYAYGGHDVVYSTWNFRHLETFDTP